MVALTWTLALLAGLACANGLGTPAVIEEYPSLVQFEFAVGTLWLQQCLGTVLTSYHVLSAASCFEGQGGRRVRAGTSYRGVDGHVVEITANYNHFSYGQYPALGYDGDISVVRLASALPLGSTISQASILGEGIDLPEGLQYTLAGWGTTAEGGIVGDNDLYKILLVNIDNEKCMESYLINSLVITENMICGGLSVGQGRDFDSRDAGAALMYADSTGQVTAVGVTSFGVSSEGDQFPIVATAISSYTSWIVETSSTV